MSCPADVEMDHFDTKSVQKFRLLSRISTHQITLDNKSSINQLLFGSQTFEIWRWAWMGLGFGCVGSLLRIG